MSVYTGQNVGTRKFDRVASGTKQGGIIAAAFATCISVTQVLGMVMTILVFSLGRWKKKMYASQPAGPELD